MLKQVALIIILLFSITKQLAVAEKLTSDYAHDIKKLMEVTRVNDFAEKGAIITIKQMLQTIQSVRPEIPEHALLLIETECIDLALEEINALGGLMDQMIPIYAKYFTRQDIRELLVFYQTPVGKKTIIVMPQLTDESMQVGQLWGESLGPEIEERVIAALIREGILP